MIKEAFFSCHIKQRITRRPRVKYEIFELKILKLPCFAYQRRIFSCLELIFLKLKRKKKRRRRKVFARN